MKNKIVAFGMAILLSSQFMVPMNATTSNPSEVVYECDGFKLFFAKMFLIIIILLKSLIKRNEIEQINILINLKMNLKTTIQK